MLIDRSDDERRRRWLVAAAVIGDLAVLGFFKYYSFFVQDVSDTLDTVGLGVPLPLMTVLLPVGISFFTFQAISYVVDVKRRLVRPASLIDCAIYLSFFPHLVAGPIVRAREFLPQLEGPRDPNKVAVGAGLGLIGLGLVKKVVIADYLGRTVVDPVFGVPAGLRRPRRADRHLRLRGPDLLRLLRLHRHRDRAGAADGVHLPPELQQPLPGDRLSRLLAPLAHDPVALPARLPLHPARRQPRQPPLHLPQPDDHDAARRALARRRLDLRALGRLPRPRPLLRARARRADRPPHPGLAAGISHLQPRLLRLDPLPRRQHRGLLGLRAALRGLGGADPVDLPGAWP